MFRVEYSPKALEDLQQIHIYISTNWGENVAKRVLKKMTSNIKRLEQYPVSGVELGKLIDVPTDYRYIFSEKSYVFYRLEIDKIRVIRVINERQDYMKQLFDKSLDSDEDYGQDNE